MSRIERLQLIEGVRDPFRALNHQGLFLQTR
jgi:hypothetical protein